MEYTLMGVMVWDPEGDGEWRAVCGVTEEDFVFTAWALLQPPSLVTTVLLCNRRPLTFAQPSLVGAKAARI